MAVIKRSTNNNAGEGAEKRKSSYTAGGNVNGYNHYGKQHGGSFKNKKIELPYDLAIPLLDIYLEKTIIQKDTCIPTFIAALFTVAKTWKQLNGPSMDGLRRCHIYTHTQWNTAQLLRIII